MTKILTIGFFLIVAFSCKDTKELQRKEGFITVSGGRIWYEIVAAEKSGTPLLLLHGGPGFTSDYLRPLEILADERPVIFYDQLGGGRSDRPQDTTLWKIDRFVNELSILRKELKLDTIHLFGHSWGTMLATEYLSQERGGIKSLILASPCISTKAWLTDTNRLRTEMPQAIQDTLKFHEDRGTVSSQAYINATEEFYKRYFCRIPHTADIQKSLNEQGTPVYNTMWGNNEFTSTGNLKTFDRTDVLTRLTMPTLFTCGEFDEATPETTRKFANEVKNGDFRVIEGAAHLTMNEKPEVYAKLIREFLNNHDTDH
jgi:proline iminopeptidase